MYPFIAAYRRLHYTLAMSTALGVSPFAMRLLPISWAENCFLPVSYMPNYLASSYPELTSGTSWQT